MFCFVSFFSVVAQKIRGDWFLLTRPQSTHTWTKATSLHCRPDLRPPAQLTSHCSRNNPQPLWFYRPEGEEAPSPAPQSQFWRVFHLSPSLELVRPSEHFRQTDSNILSPQLSHFNPRRSWRGPFPSPIARDLTPFPWSLISCPFLLVSFGMTSKERRNFPPDLEILNQTGE